MYEYRVILVRVYDGDTVFTDKDLGYHVWLKATQDPEATEDHGDRLARINAPELYTIVDGHRVLSDAGVASRDALIGFLTGKALTIQSLRLEKYGRFLVELYADGVNVNDLMLAGGWAVPYV
jgi:endonuclease YncB( thermonuclease family)